jgi:corrinoid protein of di/trimethylamine methyltransferase
MGFDEDGAKRITEEAIKAGVDPSRLIDDGLVPGVKEVGERFERGEVFLPHMVMASDAVDAAMKIIEPHLPKGRALSKGKIVMGTVEGDLHDLGKNVVIMMLKANGFEVIDIGRDVSAGAFVEKAKDLGAQIIGASSLMSTTRPYQRELIQEVERQGLKGKVKVIVGGGPVNLEWAKEIGADGYGHDASEAVREVRRLLGIED